MLVLACRFRGVGTTWPLRPGDSVEVWRDHRMIGEVPAELLIELLSYHFRGLQLQEEFRGAVVPARKPLAPSLQEKQLERSEARRTRRK